MLLFVVVVVVVVVVDVVVVVVVCCRLPPQCIHCTNCKIWSALVTRSALQWQRSGADVGAGLPSAVPLPVVVVVVAAVVVVAKVGCRLLFLLPGM